MEQHIAMMMHMERIVYIVLVLLLAAGEIACRNLPSFTKSLPMLLYDGLMGREAPGSPVPDELLKHYFLGQFFSREEIFEIGKLETARVRREVDMDLCCKTDVWFGTVPNELVDVDGEGPWPILRGQNVTQAYSRGDCSGQLPRESCPPGGECQQKTRLHLLWVQTEDGTELKYFRVNSHCSYEPEVS